MSDTTVNISIEALLKQARDEGRREAKESERKRYDASVEKINREWNLEVARLNNTIRTQYLNSREPSELINRQLAGKKIRCAWRSADGHIVFEMDDATTVKVVGTNIRVVFSENHYIDWEHPLTPA